MKYNAHNYQTYAKEFIITNPACALLLDMGLGKTVITLTALLELLFDYFEISKVLVIAPLRVAEATWSCECERWDHLSELKISKVLGSVEKRKEALHKKADIYIINRENVEWLIKSSNFKYDMVVIDELSSFKSNQSKRFKALRKVRPEVKRVIGLTGTPASNGLMDLWSEINLIDMGERLGAHIGGYRERYFMPDKRKRDVVFSYKPRDGAEEAIYKKIDDICISMKAVDYLDMPECIYNTIEVQLSETERKLYLQLERDMILPFAEGDIDAVNAAALSNKLLQLSNGAVYDENKNAIFIHDRKLDALEDLIEAANGKPLLIFYAFKHDKDRIIQRFHARVIDTSEDIKDWNDGKIPIAIVHPASAGSGLNLQMGGSTAIWFGLTYSLEFYSQANARLWRQGQRNTVVIYHIVTKGTVDEDVLAALERKDVTQEALLAAMKARIGGE
jgi:Superfamily II DNA/RNA helicases, SNF2 family